MYTSFVPQEANSTRDAALTFKSCKSWGVNYDDSCTSTGQPCLRTELPADLETRIRSLGMSENGNIPIHVHRVLRQMSSNFKGSYDVIIATAVSMNHFEEAKVKMINNLLRKHELKEINFYKDLLRLISRLYYTTSSSVNI